MKLFFSLLIVLLLCTFMVDAQGIYQLYGMTEIGGEDNIGVLFSTNYAGDNLQVKHNFTFTNPGGDPVFTQPVEYNGKLYGMTDQGGAYNAGVIFEWDPGTNIYTKKFDFNNEIGSSPKGSLTLQDGKFYGMSWAGGTGGAGVIFEWDPATNIYTKKHDFAFGDDGYQPNGNLTYRQGKFYGMATEGGIHNSGVIFEWDPDANTYTKMIDLDEANGESPFGSLTFYGGKFYGMTFGGGNTNQGVIFEWDLPTDTYTKMIDLDGTNGAGPQGNLTFSGGMFYGMTKEGGSNNLGVIFEWDPNNNIYTKKVDLTEAGGSHPYGSLTQRNGKFYGITYSGGNNDNYGAIFEWEPENNIYTKKFAMTSESGNAPRGSLTLNNGKFYGMTQSGGCSSDNGVIFEWQPDSNLYSKKIAFINPTNGLTPKGGLVSFAGKDYGVTNGGGSTGMGAIYEWDPSASVFTKKFDFNIPLNGSSPATGLALNNGKFYGMCSGGGANGQGVIFEWDPVTNIYSKKIDLNDSIGSWPLNSIILKAGKFYGTTSNGGLYNSGVIFEWDPATNIYTKKFDFDAATGYYPFGGLTLYDGIFYGMTWIGGSNDAGVIFEWEPESNVYTKKFDFDSSNGFRPTGNLTLKGRKFYGMASNGGLYNGGVIFEWNPANNRYVKRADLNNTDGGSPSGSLTLNNEKFYGTTAYGGNNNQGIFFEWNPTSSNGETNDFIKKADFNGSNGNANLASNLSLLPAPVANGLGGNCMGFAPVTIDNSNNNLWVPITDNDGNAVAEINARGNNLGIVNTSMYINTAAIRENLIKKMYLDRNLTITPAIQPDSAIDIRLYIKAAEYERLKNAINSKGKPSGISDINDVKIFTNRDLCVPALRLHLSTANTLWQDWNKDYVSTATVSYLGSFYFGTMALLQTAPVLSLSPFGRSIPNNSVVLYPNPVIEKINLSIKVDKTQQVQGKLLDNSGRIIKKIQWNLSAGTTSLSLDVSNLTKGFYTLEIEGEAINEHKQFVKQ